MVFVSLGVLRCNNEKLVQKNGVGLPNRGFDSAFGESVQLKELGERKSAVQGA